MTAVVRVAIVDDDALTREGLQALINGTPGFRCVGTVGSVSEALREFGRATPDVVLLDVNMPGTSGPEGAATFRLRFPDMQILMLSVYGDEGRVFESICNGACGYLLKKTPPAKLLEAIREASEGGAPMSPEIARKVVTLFQRTRRPRQDDHDLTDREVRLLALLAEGCGYQSAADRLGISINTVRNHVRSVYEKLHVHSKSEAVSKAIRSGIL
jgi:DNA-binding NarL/FixJ family response regulator